MVAIILVNWNGCLDTIECLESLLRSQNQDFIVFIVDNRSSDNSLQIIEAWAAKTDLPAPTLGPWPKLPQARVGTPRMVRVNSDGASIQLAGLNIILIEADENLGFAGANNLALSYARAWGQFSHYWFLNNDTVVDPACLAHLKTLSDQEPMATLVGSRLMYYALPELVQGVGGFFLPWKARAGHLGAKMLASELPSRKEIEAKTQYVMGASLFLPALAIEQLGPMSQDYFLYFEELDWAMRLGNGQKMCVCLDAVIYHKEGGSIGTSSVARPSDTSLYYLNTNLIRFMSKFYRPLVGIAYLRVLREMLKYLAPVDRKAIRSLWAAICDRLTGRNRSGPIRW